MRKITRKGIVRKLDKIVGDIVKARDGKCIVCECRSTLEPGHLFSRIAYSTRWDLENVYAQCHLCNFRHENDPYPMMDMVERILSKKKVEALHRRYVTPRKFKTFELEELYETLKHELIS